MPYIVLIIQPDGTIAETIQPKAPTYEQQRDAVKGYIETVPYFTSIEHKGVTYKSGTAYANEEGILKGMQYNVRASLLWRKACPKGDPNWMRLHGPVIFFAKLPKQTTIASADKSPHEQRNT